MVKGSETASQKEILMGAGVSTTDIKTRSNSEFAKKEVSEEKQEEKDQEREDEIYENFQNQFQAPQ
jgi:hypothetical protein